MSSWQVLHTSAPTYSEGLAEVETGAAAAVGDDAGVFCACAADAGLLAAAVGVAWACAKMGSDHIPIANTSFADFKTPSCGITFPQSSQEQIFDI
jgi:hypothetical protein